MPGWILWPAAVATAFGAAFGPVAAAFFLISSSGGIFFLEVINYVEHYGLRRCTMPSGNHESVSVGHSWNANHMVRHVQS
jgi:alkane 1-monooxygenase